MKMVVLSVLFLLPALGLGQGNFLEGRTSGAGANLGLAANEDVLIYSMSAGLSILGVVDVGLSFGGGPAHHASQASVVSFSPSISVYLVKGDSIRPFSFALEARFQNDRYSSSDPYFQLLSSRSFAFGPSIFMNVGVTDEIKLQPAVSFLVGSGSTDIRYTGPAGGSETGKFQLSVFAAGASVLWEVSPVSVAVLTPSIGYNLEGNARTYGLSASLVYSLPNLFR